jgi:hypothetical protein
MHVFTLMEPDTCTMSCVANGENQGVNSLDGVVSARLCMPIKSAEIHMTCRYDFISVQILHSGQSMKANLRAFQSAASVATSPRICTGGSN